MANLKIYLNADTADSPLETSGVDWVEVSQDNDSLIFTAGSDVVKDGEPIPSQSDLNQAAIVLTGVETIVDKYLLADISAAVLKEIHNMGNQNKRYVVAFEFDDATASEPVLEVWDDTDYDSVDSISLGEGVPANSWIRGIVTTDGLPGSDWVGSTLAGASAGHFLWLNNENGALASADTLYCQLKIVVPASANVGLAEQPEFAIKFTSN